MFPKNYTCEEEEVILFDYFVKHNRRQRYGIVESAHVTDTPLPYVRYITTFFT